MSDVIDASQASTKFLISMARIASGDQSLAQSLDQFGGEICRVVGWVTYRVTLMQEGGTGRSDLAGMWIEDLRNYERELREVWDRALSDGAPSFVVQEIQPQKLAVIVIPLRLASKAVAVIECFTDRPSLLEDSTVEMIEIGIEQIQAYLLRKDTELKLKKSFQDLQETQQQLIQSEKMASLGTIAAGVAHEINNPLSFLLSNVESLEVYVTAFTDTIHEYDLLRESLDTASLTTRSRKHLSQVNSKRQGKDLSYMMSDYRELLRESLEGISRIRSIVSGLKTFSRPYDAELDEVDVNECLLTALRVVSNEMRYKCVLRKSLVEVPPISCNPGHLLQVFMNILLNAIQAIESRGLIEVKSYFDDYHVYISISDNGVGIPTDALSRLFTPFFTTKPAGQGTGLGLSVSYGIVKNLSGSIEVKSEPGVGSVFTVKIPYRKGESL